MFQTFTLVFFFLFSTAFGETPKAVYLSWQKHPESTMTIQWLTSKNAGEGIAYVKKSSDPDWVKGEALNLFLPNGAPYILHRLEVTNLEPDTEYLFRMDGEAEIYKFLTLPKDLKKPLSFVVGGDIYHDKMKNVLETNLQVARCNPRFAILGGDIAYAANRYFLSWEKNERWIDFLATWTKTMVDAEGHLIPILAVIGNHDVTGRYHQTPEKAPFFYTLFPTPGYEVLDAGNYLSLFLLDSGHTHPVRGEQTHWLYHALASRTQIPNKFAIYHVPAYPSIRDYQNTPISVEIRKNWVPFFEEFGLNAAFEHHDHAYKRTYPIRQNERKRHGVVYIGDGAWGVDKPRTRSFFSKEPWYLAAFKSTRNFILVTLDGKGRTFQAINPLGEVIDTYSN